MSHKNVDPYVTDSSQIMHLEAVKGKIAVGKGRASCPRNTESSTFGGELTQLRLHTSGPGGRRNPSAFYQKEGCSKWPCCSMKLAAESRFVLVSPPAGD